MPDNIADVLAFNGVLDIEVQAFDMYFASLCSMQVHPGAGTKGHAALSIEQCKDMAVDMLKVRRGVLLMADGGK